MAFLPDFARPVGRNSNSGNIIWVYHSTTDTLATIKAASYFSTTSKDFAVNDIIFVVGTDGCNMLCISAIDGGGNVTAPPVDIQADEVGTDTLPDIGLGTQNNVQEALTDVYNAVNLKIQNIDNVGSGIAVGAGIDATDPTDRQLQLRRLLAGFGIDITTGGSDTITIAADNSVLSSIASTGGGGNLVRNGNASGVGEVRSLTSDTGTIDFNVEGPELDINVNSAPTAGGSTTTTFTMDSGSGVDIVTGAGSPEGAVSASRGSLYLRTGGSAATSILYAKQTGSGNTGWIRFDSTLPA